MLVHSGLLELGSVLFRLFLLCVFVLFGMLCMILFFFGYFLACHIGVGVFCVWGEYLVF